MSASKQIRSGSARSCRPTISVRIITQQHEGHPRETISANSAKPGGAGNYPRGETLAVLRQIGQETAQELREQTDEHLDRTRSTPLTDSNPVSAERVTELGLIGHATQHLARIKATRGQPVG